MLSSFKSLEGLVFKNPNSFYERKRSWGVLKVKDFLDGEGIVEQVKLDEQRKRMVYLRVRVLRDSLPEHIKDELQPGQIEVKLKHGGGREKTLQRVKQGDQVSFKFRPAGAGQGPLKEALFWRLKGL